VKLDVDKASTVPDDPPAAGPDRALVPPPRPPAKPPTAAVVEVLLPAVVDGGAALADEPHAARPIPPHINAAAVIRRLLLFDGNLVGSFMTAFLSGATATSPRRPGRVLERARRGSLSRHPAVLPRLRHAIDVALAPVRVHPEDA